MRALEGSSTRLYGRCTLPGVCRVVQGVYGFNRLTPLHLCTPVSFRKFLFQSYRVPASSWWKRHLHMPGIAFQFRYLVCVDSNRASAACGQERATQPVYKTLYGYSMPVCSVFQLLSCRISEKEDIEEESIWCSRFKRFRVPT